MPEIQPGDVPSVPEVEQLVRRWHERSLEAPVDRDAERLAGLLRDPRGLEFAVGFVDRVMRPDDDRVAAQNLERLSRRLPQFLPAHLRAAVVAGGGFGVLLSRPIMPIVRQVFRRMVGHLVVTATPESLDKALVRVRKPGIRLDLTVLGPTVLGQREAGRRRGALAALLARPDVDHVSFPLADVAARLSPWGFDAAVERAVEAVLPLFQQAARAQDRKVITLEIGRIGDLDLTLAVFRRVLGEPELRGLEAGIVLPAAFPDSLAALDRLTSWARERVAGGGVGIRVRIVKGAHIAEERVDATLRGLPLPTWESKVETDAHYKRMLDYALRPEHTDAVRVGVAGHNLFDLAYAHLLATSRGVAGRMDVEMMLGMASELADAIRVDTGAVVLLAPVVDPGQFDAAVAYLVRRLDEAAGSQNFLPALFDLDDDEVFARESGRFAEALALSAETPVATRRTQDRARPEVPKAPDPFVNDSPTDATVPGNRVWARGILTRARESRIGRETLDAAALDAAAVPDRVRAAAEAGADWGRRPGHERAELLDRAGEVLVAFRGRLVEVLVSETATTFADADAEAGEVVDLAYYAAARARELAGMHGAIPRPVALTIVTPSAGRGIAGAAGALSALAAGSAVLLKPAPTAARSAAVVAEALWEAGIPPEVLGLVDVRDEEGIRALVTAPEVGRVLHAGAFETAELLRSWRADLPLLAVTPGTNSVIVTPSADHDLAVADLLRSAFARSGQEGSHASLAILVGSTATSERFRRQLVDAVESLAAGSAFDPVTEVGPLLEPAVGPLLGELTQLAEGESWLVAPRQLDEAGRRWAPGIRDGVRPGSAFHLLGSTGPVLGLMAAEDLAEAIELQNATGSGLVAGLASLDATEVATWLEAARAGSLVVNRPTTGALVGRQPTGGWGRSAVGPGTKSGGVNTLLPLADWTPDDGEPSEQLHLDGLEPRVRAVIEAFQPALDFTRFDRVRRAALLDEETWVAEYGRRHDPAALGVERNIRLYRPAEVVVRLAEGGDLGDLARVLCAGVRVRARMLVSTATPLPSGLLPLIDDGTPLAESPLRVLGVQVESDESFRARCERGHPARIRLVGGDAGELATALAGSPDTAVWSAPVTIAGRIELLPFLREQSVSITTHRHGMPDRDLTALVV